MPISTPEPAAENAAAELAVPNTSSAMPDAPSGMFVFCVVLCAVYNIHTVDGLLFARLSTSEMQL